MIIFCCLRLTDKARFATQMCPIRAFSDCKYTHIYQKQKLYKKK